MSTLHESQKTHQQMLPQSALESESAFNREGTDETGWNCLRLASGECSTTHHEKPGFLRPYAVNCLRLPTASAANHEGSPLLHRQGPRAGGSSTGQKGRGCVCGVAVGKGWGINISAVDHPLQGIGYRHCVLLERSDGLGSEQREEVGPTARVGLPLLWAKAGGFSSQTDFR
ncbi:MAG: hypothetical protein HKL81_03165 [Acidimicrobiaceae bacterium]|nr:hypothetical protein [Acidimicrobiaceae bacterium]